MSQHVDLAEEKFICRECVKEPYLSQELARTGTLGTCSYCNQRAHLWSIGELADRVEKAFEAHYLRTSDQPNWYEERMLADKEMDYNWYRDGEPVFDAVQSAAEIPSDAVTDVLEILEDRHSDWDAQMMGEETEFHSDSYYVERSASSAVWQSEWTWFEESLKSEARFFSSTAAALLASVFGDIDKVRTHGRRPLVVSAGPGTSLKHLYRARVFQNDALVEQALCRPDLHLGSPPTAVAAAGRMNARGISVFYGATQKNTTIAEVRPPVGSRVLVGKFSFIRRLRLLDLTVIETAIDGGSIFDPTLKPRLERIAFLRSLGQRMTRPVMPDDEALDYLATQAVADFLATENQPSVDGILYRSAQVKGGRNVVLFHRAARVDLMILPKGTQLSARSYTDSDEGPELDYHVSEAVPPTASLPEETSQLSIETYMRPQNDLTPWDGRDPSMEVDSSSLEVHWVDYVAVRTTPHNVFRHRYEISTEPTF